MNKEDIIFTAGFFAGEGTVTLCANKGGGYSGGISVDQLDRESLDRLQALWGGGICISKSNGKPSTWKWQRNTKLALPCLKAILPVVRGWSAFNAERIEKYIEFYTIPSADWRARSRIVAWFKTCIENHKKACHEYLDTRYLKKEEQIGRA